MKIRVFFKMVIFVTPSLPKTELFLLFYYFSDYARFFWLGNNLHLDYYLAWIILIDEKMKVCKKT